MSANYLYQIVYCSQRKGRAFRREIAISSNSAMVTNVEILPPGYDVVMDRMRDRDEDVYSFAVDLKTVRDDIGCPFCGNRTTFTCDPQRGGCGVVSCISRDHNGHHCCPGCDVVHRAVPADTFLVSKSGFVDGSANATHRLNGGANKQLGEEDTASYWRRLWEESQRRQVIDAEVIAPPGRLQRLLPGLQKPLDKIQDALRRGLPPAQNRETKDLPGLPWTKLLCDGAEHQDEDGDKPLPPGPPPHKLLGDGRDAQGAEDRLARLAERLNRNKQ